MNVFADIFCVVVGGAAGAMLRWFFASLFDKKFANFPVGTFAANMLATFLLSAAAAIIMQHPVPRAVELMFETGFCATLSTFSSLAGQISDMLGRRNMRAALIYANATFISGIAMFLSAEFFFKTFF